MYKIYNKFLYIIIIILVGMPGCIPTLLHKRKIVGLSVLPSSSFPLDISLPIDAILSYESAQTLLKLSKKYIFTTHATYVQLKDFYMSECIDAGWSLQNIFEQSDNLILIFEKPAKNLLIHLVADVNGRMTIIVMINYHN